jgi:hypothetical protein
MGKLSRNNKNICGQTILQFSGEGTNGSASIFDDGLTEHIFGIGTPEISTSIADPFGRSKGVLDFPGSAGGYISVLDHEDFNFSNLDFTIEMWIRPETQIGGSAFEVYTQRADTNNRIVLDCGSNMAFFQVDGGSTIFNYTVSDTTPYMNNNQWHHIAFVRNGPTGGIYIDGILRSTENTAFGSQTLGNIASQLVIGARGDLSTNFFDGQISNYRVIKGHALYTKNFTVPTNPFAKCFKPSDISSLHSWWRADKDVYTDAGVTLATDGQTVQEFHTQHSSNPHLNQTTETNKPTFQINEVNGRPSVRFDGVDNFLEATGAAGNWSFLHDGTAYTTFVAYKRNTNLATLLATNATGSPTVGFAKYVDSTPELAHRIYKGVTGQAVIVQQAADPQPLGEFGIMELSYDGLTGNTQARVLSNGQLKNIDTAMNLPHSSSDPLDVLHVGALTTGGSPLDGDIAEIVIFNSELSDQDVNRVRRYLAFKYDITAPQKPLCITDAGTPDQVLLLHGEGPDTESDFLDSSDSAHTITANGNVQHDTSEKPFGFSSILFDGSDGYISIADSDDFHFGSNDFTIDFWLYANTLVNGSVIATKIDTSPFSEASWQIYLDVNNLQFYADSNGDANWDVVFGLNWDNITTGAWNHHAITRQGNTFRVFTNGVLSNTAESSSAIFNSSEPLVIGANLVPGNYWDGNIKEFRIVKGTAVYTENFKPKKNFYCDN